MIREFTLNFFINLTSCKCGQAKMKYFKKSKLKFLAENIHSNTVSSFFYDVVLIISSSPHKLNRLL